MSNEKINLDVAIVGGGIVGLWCAHSILKKYPNYSLAVLEAEAFLGEHTSGRNSEVLHSGIYYPTGSLKHVHCLEGNRLWREFVQEKNLPFLDCGKVIAAIAGQEQGLAALLEQGRRNGVSGIEPLSHAEIESLREILHIDQGFRCASSGVLNVAEAMRALRLDVESRGGMVLPKTKVKILGFSAENFHLDLGGSEIETRNLVCAAGLSAVEFRRSLGLSNYENFFVKGSYLKLRKRIRAETLVYPLPPADGLGLGVHITLDTAGDQKFGPNTEFTEKVDYSLEDGLLEKMLPAIQRVFKNIEPSDLLLGYSGIRPKVKKDGVLVTDFVLNTEAEHQIKGYFEFLGIESPGLTASPSLARLLAFSI